MQIDLELYRRPVTVATKPVMRLSVIDVAPDLPQKTLVFLHGFGGQATQWRYQLEHCALTQRVIALDLRGHGHADKPPGAYTMPELQHDLEVAFATLQLPERFVLVGHSFGGALATEYALAHPEQIEHLFLIATAGEFKLNWLTRCLFGLPLALLRPLERFARGWLNAPFHALKPWYQNTLSQWRGWERWRLLTTPTTVIRGHLDFLFEKPLFEKVAATIPQAEDVDVGASGHLVMLERREAVNRTIDRVLAGTATRSWRADDQLAKGEGRGTLLRQRPWLAHYDPTVPFTLAVPNVPLPFLLESAARRFPQQVALQTAAAQLTYQQLDHWANRFAHALLAHGVRPGDRVMLLLPDLPQFVIAFYGVLKMGAVVVLTPPAEPETLRSQLEATAAKGLVTMYEHSELALQMQTYTSLELLVLTQRAERLDKASTPPMATPPGLHHFTAFLAGQPTTAPETPASATHLALIQYTSGTTGAAKGVMLSHRNLVANTLQTRHWLAAAKEGKERFLCALSFSHIYGLTTTLNVPIALGATLILESGTDLARVLNAIKRHKPTIFPGTPGMYVAINNFPDVRKYGIESIKFCLSGSAPLPVEVQEGFEKLTKGRLVEGYGLTEAAPVTHANPLNGRAKVGSIGVPLPSTEAAIFALTGGETTGSQPLQEPGQIGELAVRGPQVMLGYWQQPTETAQVLHDGWLLTGDVAQLDSEGYFRIIARKADMWYPNHANLANHEPAFPRDIEEVLYEIPQVKEVAVIALANQPIAFVTTQADRPTAETLIAYCRRRLPPELVPLLVIFVDDFPRNFIGKILRRELVKRFEHLKQLSDFTAAS